MKREIQELISLLEEEANSAKAKPLGVGYDHPTIGTDVQAQQLMHLEAGVRGLRKSHNPRLHFQGEGSQGGAPPELRTPQEHAGPDGKQRNDGRRKQLLGRKGKRGRKASLGVGLERHGKGQQNIGREFQSEGPSGQEGQAAGLNPMCGQLA